jgi:hypothetical protein
MCVSIFAIALPQVSAAKPVPSISLTTTTDKTNAQVGGTVTYTFEVTNTGKVTLFGVEVDGNVTGVATKQSESIRTNDKLESWETWVFTATYTVQEGDPDPLVNMLPLLRTPERAKHTATLILLMFIFTEQKAICFRTF